MANLNAVLTKPKISENYARNAFDRSECNKLTYQLGGLTPFFCQPFIAGSHVKLNRSIFQRTAAVNTAAFPTVDTHCEFFAVPIRLLWSYWNNWKLNIQDFNSSYFGAYNSQGSFVPKVPRLPYINLQAIRDNLLNVIYDKGGTPADYNLFVTTKTEAVGANRLLDALGYGFVHNHLASLSDQGDAFYVNPLKLLAYQKIYYDHFRNTAYESNDPSYYNLDFWSQDSNPVPNYEVAKMLTYRYVNYRKDYFQALYPALNYVSSSPSGLQWTVPDSVMYKYSTGNPFGSQSDTSIETNGNNEGVTVLRAPVHASLGVSFTTVQQIRAAFALDKLLRASAYAPKHVKDQFEARYGVKNVESGNESIRIGAYINDILFQEVTNTADSLGAIGAKGVGSSGGFGKEIEFTCKEDTIIMGLIYSMPRSSYDSTRLDNWNAKRLREDFFVPEYMNLGLQPLYRFELDAPMSYPLADSNVLVGYQDRYMEYKQGVDRNTGLFNLNQPMSDFVNHTQSSKVYYPILGSSGVNYRYFKVDPSDLDSVFAQNTDPSDMTTDKFITHITVKCVCNQNMSVHGQPMSGGLG